MQIHHVKVHPSKARLPREEQLAWKLASVAADMVPVQPDVTEQIINRIIDNAAVAIAAMNRGPVVAAREMALGHPRQDGATILGLPWQQRFSPDWTAWANGTAVRELDMHDTFLGADYSHPGDNIPPILAVAQAMNRTGQDLIRGIALQPMATPKIRPIAAVTTIAKAPPMVTRNAARPSGAPPR